MKNRLVSLYILLLACISLNAQDRGKDKSFDLEKFKATKMAYLVQEAGITPEEAVQLTPLYFEMQEKRFKLMMKARSKSKNINGNSCPSNDECIKMLDEILDNQIEDANIEKAYYQKFKKILSPQKILKLKHADFRFAHEMLKQKDKRKPIHPESK